MPKRTAKFSSSIDQLIKPVKKKYQTLSSDARRSFWFLAAGILLLLSYSIWRYQYTRRLSFNTTVSSTFNSSKVTNIAIPKVRLNLSVEEAGIIDGVWQISEVGASHLATSANPGDNGNIIIYGHNKNILLGPIRWLDVGEQITLTTEDGQTHDYQIREIITATADDISYVLPKPQETLTLYTCTGFWDQKRHLLISKPLEP